MSDITPNGPTKPSPRPPEFSGAIIVRLRPELASAAHAATRTANPEIARLRLLLEGFGLPAMRPVVRSASPETIARLERAAADSKLPPLHSLNAYWRIDARKQERRAEEIVKTLAAFPGVETAYRERTATDPVVNAANDPFNATQTYLDAAPTGIDARWMWTQPNGEGAGINVIDLEQGWIPTHEDLAGRSPTLIHGDNRDGIGGYVGNHGTAVLGEILAIDNTRGVVGIAPSIASVRMVSHYDAATNTSGHVADGVVSAIGVLSPGDVLLLEIQKGATLLPTETEAADFDAIRLAVALGIVVVEAGGNGGNDLDAFTDGGGHHILNRGSPDFRDSGAIMVGAASSSVPHNRLSFSNFGSRIDCYAYGENVTTTAYGDLTPGEPDRNKHYTAGFSGTSSASPIVTGAAILLQGNYAAANGTRLSPLEMRALLSDATLNTPQGGGVAGHIGVMPNLRAITLSNFTLKADVYLRDFAGDTGAVPSSGAISTSPDIIVRKTAVANPTASFGQGSGTENDETLGSTVEAGQPNFVYVRMKNRGGTAAPGVTAKVYWSPVSTLVTPTMWTLIGTTTPVNVPAGNTLVVAPALTWPAAAIPGTGHYCFVGVLNQATDPAPPLPASMSWNDFTALIRNQNNVTWRNFNVVNDDPSADPVEMKFLVAGAHDRARAFDLQVLPQLPRGAALALEVPAQWAPQLEKAGLKGERRRNTIRVALPEGKRGVTIAGLKLERDARYDVRLVLRGGEGYREGDFRVAVRQVFQRLEVGRVTWAFRPRKG